MNQSFISCCCIQPNIEFKSEINNLINMEVEPSMNPNDTSMNMHQDDEHKENHVDDDATKKSMLLIKDNMPIMMPTHLPKDRKVLHDTTLTQVFYHDGQVYKIYDLNNMEWIREIDVLTYVTAYQHSSFIWANAFSLDCAYIKVMRSDLNLPVDNQLWPRLCCVMEVPFYSHRLLDEIGMTDDKHLLQIFVDILDGITFMHNNNIMHRDLKLANVMIDNDGRAKIIDFSHSLHRRIKNLRLDSFVATYDHRAPEAFIYEKKRRVPYTEAIDVWAVGMMLFQVVTGLISSKHICKSEEQAKAIFTGKEDAYMSMLSDMYKISTKFTKLRYANEYFTWITKMLKQDPKQRITAKAMLTEIISLCENKNIDIQLATYHGMDKVFDASEMCDCSSAESEVKTHTCNNNTSQKDEVKTQPIVCEPIELGPIVVKHNDNNNDNEHKLDKGEKNLEDVETLFRDDYQLTQTCSKYADEILGLLLTLKELNNMQYDPVMICDMVIYLWDNGLRDMYELCLAVTILVESLIYDNVHYGIEQYVNFVNETRHIAHTFDMNLVKCYIWTIVERYEEQLFLNDTFVFENRED